MIIPRLVVPNSTLLNALLGNIQRNMNFPVFATVGSHDTKFHSIQRMSGISSG